MNPQNTTDDPAQNQGNPMDNSNGAQPADQASYQTDDSAQTAVEIDLPLEAEDNDLIEKEWVDRAKQIVEHTREDPYEQQRALSQMKADYMKKRYNKDIKISDG